MLQRNERFRPSLLCSFYVYMCCPGFRISLIYVSPETKDAYIPHSSSFFVRWGCMWPGGEDATCHTKSESNHRTYTFIMLVCSWYLYLSLWNKCIEMIYMSICKCNKSFNLLDSWLSLFLNGFCFYMFIDLYKGVELRICVLWVSARLYHNPFI